MLCFDAATHSWCEVSRYVYPIVHVLYFSDILNLQAATTVVRRKPGPTGKQQAPGEENNSSEQPETDTSDQKNGVQKYLHHPHRVLTGYLF